MMQGRSQSHIFRKYPQSTLHCYNVDMTIMPLSEAGIKLKAFKSLSVWKMFRLSSPGFGKIPVRSIRTGLVQQSWRPQHFTCCRTIHGFGIMRFSVAVLCLPAIFPTMNGVKSFGIG